MDDVLSSFLVKIVYDQDQKSKKDFDEGLKQVQSHAAEFGEKISALPAIVSDATKRISSSLTQLFYSAQKNGATARELDALRYAAKQSGEGADKAEASFNSFSQRIRDFATGASLQYKALFGIDVDPNHTLDAFINVRQKIEELRNKGGAENLSRANLYARTFGIDEDALIPGRITEFKKRFDEQLKRNSDIAAEKAVALTRAYNALAAALETVARKADAALFDKFVSVLDRITKWLDDESERIVKFFTELVTQIGLVFTDLGKLRPAFVLLWDALKEVGGWLQKIIGQPDSSGLAGVRHLLEFISGAVMIRFVAGMVAGFIAAFAPLTALIAGLAALGIIGIGAYKAGEAIRGVFGGEQGAGAGGFGPGEATEGGGHGAGRRRKFGHHEPSSELDRSSGGNLGKEGWWTQERQKHAYERLREGGVSDAGAKGLISRWVNVESRGGPGSVNPSSGAVGIAQWLGSRKIGITSHTSFDDQLNHVIRELSRSESAAGRLLKEANTPEEAAKAATAYERAEGYNASTHIDNWTAKTLRGIERVGKALTGSGSVAPPDHVDPHKSDFDPKAVPFHDYFKGQPLGTDQHSMNQINDHRAVHNDVNIHVSGHFPIEKTERPLSRPRNADLIRNTASYAA